MTNIEKKEQLENDLRKQRTKTRIIQALVFLAFLAIGIVTWALREASKEVIVHGEEFLDGIFSWESVKYNCPNCKKIVIDYADGSMDLNGEKEN